jgi:phospholipid/cholesterol/gamma-HCH transport system ATP-binding protein
MTVASTSSTDMSPAAHNLGDALRRALEHDGDARVLRLTRMGSSVRFVIEGDDTTLTLLLDRTPPVVTSGDEPAEITFSVPRDLVAELAFGRLPMAPAVIAGEVTGSGPIRQYLEIDPILQSLLRDVAGHGGEHVRRPAGPALSSPDRDLLAIETRDVHKRFGRQRVLTGMDLAIPEGVISVILGPSGTGKSVLLQHIIGLMRPDRGEVRVRGRSLTTMSRSELLRLRREVGVMFQDGALFSGLNIFDNVAFPLREHTNLGEREVEHIVMTRLREVGLESARERLPAQLSGGMKKRAGLARALVLDPGIVLCDEPDSGLDPVRTALLGDLLVEQHANGGGTMIVVTHNITLAKRIADHISVLWQGGILQSGIASQIFQSEDPFVEQFLAGETVGPLTME